MGVYIYRRGREVEAVLFNLINYRDGRPRSSPDDDRTAVIRLSSNKVVADTLGDGKGL